MNPYELIMKIDRKMKQDPNFAQKFNKLVAEFNRTPGLQQQVMRIAQIQDERKRKIAFICKRIEGSSGWFGLIIEETG